MQPENRIMDYKNKIMEYEIIHQPEQNLFKTEVDGRTAFVQYRLLAYIIHSGFISGYQNRYGDNLKPPTNVYHRMTA